MGSAAPEAAAGRAAAALALALALALGSQDVRESGGQCLERMNVAMAFHSGITGGTNRAGNH